MSDRRGRGVQIVLIKSQFLTRIQDIRAESRGHALVGEDNRQSQDIDTD